MADRARPTAETEGHLSDRDQAPTIDFTRLSIRWCLYAAIMLLAGLLLLNPLALSLIVHMSLTRSIYLLFLDAMLVAIVVFCLRHLRWGQKRDLVLAIGIGALVPIALILIEPAIIAAHEAYGPTTGDQEAEADAALHQPDPLLGWQPRPGVRARHVSQGNFDVTYTIDAQRNRQIPTNPRAPLTLHFFGDSIVFGHGVANDETALNLVARALGDRANVVNHGVMAYGLEQMFLRLRDSQDQVQPGDAVIFAPIAEDVERNLIGKTFVCTLYEKDYSAASTLPLLDHGAWRAEPIADYCPKGDLPMAMARRYLMALHRPGLDQQLAANADAVLDLARALARDRGAAFFVLFLVRADECETKTFLFDLDLIETPYTSLMPFCPVNPAALRFATDRHFNAEGQRWMAAAILDFLKQNVLDDR